MTPQAHTDAQAVPATDPLAVAFHDARYQVTPVHNGGSEPFAEPIVPCGYCTRMASDLRLALPRHSLTLAEAASLVTAPDLDVETLGRAWLNAMTEGEHDEECLRPTQAQDCPVGYEVREFVPKIAAEYIRLRAAASPTAHSEDRSHD